MEQFINYIFGYPNCIKQETTSQQTIDKLRINRDKTQYRSRIFDEFNKTGKLSSKLESERTA